MFTFILSTILAAAPIPKTTNNGTIGFIINGTKSELILLSPSGKELKRLELNDLDGRAYTVKLAASGEFAIVTATANRASRIGNNLYTSSSGYLLRLDGKSKPELLVDNKANLKWVLNQDATHMIATELDLDKMANAKRGEVMTKSWKFDLKTKKQEPISLPSSYLPTDITADGSTLLTYSVIDGKYRTGITPTSTWKPAFISEASEIPHGISPDGKKLFLLEYRDSNAKGTRNSQLYIYDVKTKERTAIASPAECIGTMAYSFGADGKHVAMVGYVQERIPNGVTYSYKLYTCKIDGSGLKLLFESKPGEYISDVDWR